MTAAQEEVRTSRPRPGVLRIELARPDRLNAMTAGMVEQLHEALTEAERDPGCRVVVLTGAGRGFCAGLDLDGYGTPPGAPEEGAAHRTLRTQRHIASLVQRIRRLPQPVVAQVNGAAAGGGLALVCAADVRLAATEAVFAVSFIRVGFSGCDIGTSYFLPRLVGVSVASELILTGRFIGAERALAVGLVSEVVEEGGLDAAVEPYVDAMMTASPVGLRLSKECLNMSVDAGSIEAVIAMEDRNQVLCSRSEEFNEGIRAFLEKRKPVYIKR